MRTKKTIFSQIMSLVSRYDFQKCVDRYKGDWHAKTLTCIDQFKIMSFAQFTDRSSLRDIEIYSTEFGDKAKIIQPTSGLQYKSIQLFLG